VSKGKVNCPQTGALNLATFVSYDGVPLSTADCAAATTVVSGKRCALGSGRRISGGYMRDEGWEWE